MFLTWLHSQVKLLLTFFPLAMFFFLTCVPPSFSAKRFSICVMRPYKEIRRRVKRATVMIAFPNLINHDVPHLKNYPLHHEVKFAMVGCRVCD